jgi:hypothetical protein
MEGIAILQFIPVHAGLLPGLWCLGLIYPMNGIKFPTICIYPGIGYLYNGHRMPIMGKLSKVWCCFFKHYLNVQLLFDNSMFILNKNVRIPRGMGIVPCLQQ